MELRLRFLGVELKIGKAVSTPGSSAGTWVSVGSGVESGGQIKPLARESAAYADEGYAQNVVVFRCVDIRSKALATIPIKLLNKEGEEIEEHALLDLLKKPNPIDTYDTLIENFVAFRDIVGNTYMEVITVGKGEPKELWVWPPFHMNVVVPSVGYVPLGYVFDDGNPSHRRAWEVDKFGRTPCDLGHWKTFNARSCFVGMSPLSAAALSVDQHNGAAVWNRNLLGNNAAPPGAVIAPKDAVLSEAQFARLKAEMQENYQGALNARRPMLLEGGLDWKQFSMTPVDMDYTNGKLNSAQEIAGTYGVPIQIIPLPGSQTFANYKEARLAFFEDTAIPMHGSMLEFFNQWLVPRYPDLEGAKLVADLSQVPALAERRAEKATSINNASYMTINEKRREMNLPEVDDPAADMVYTPAGMLPLGFDPTEGEETKNPTKKPPRELAEGKRK